VPPLDRLGDRVRATGARAERLLVLYLTVGDPLSDDLELPAVRAGADVLELGIPTANTSPRGATMAESFDRARETAPERAFERIHRLRESLPDVPMLILVYPQTVTDLGAERLLALAEESDVDGLVLTDPEGALTATRVAASSLSAVPLVTPGTEAAKRRRLEDTARHFTYQALADRTGASLDPEQVGRFAETAASSASKPFLAGFGIRDEPDIRAVAPHAAGVVIGSELYRGLSAAAPANRVTWTRAAVARWKSATVLSGPEYARSAHAR
jgi:tryptophan synthase alpha chain